MITELKSFMNENEMEKYLLNNKYNIFDMDINIDSTMVIENAIDLGYRSKLNEETQTLEFNK